MQWVLDYRRKGWLESYGLAVMHIGIAMILAYMAYLARGQEGQTGNFYFPMFASGAAFCLFVAWLFQRPEAEIREMIRRGRPGLTIDEAGIWFHGLDTNDLFAWPTIEAITVKRNRGLVIFELASRISDGRTKTRGFVLSDFKATEEQITNAIEHFRPGWRCPS